MVHFPHLNPLSRILACPRHQGRGEGVICTTFADGMNPFRYLFPEKDNQTLVLEFVRAHPWTSAGLELSVALTRSALICLGLRKLIERRWGKRGLGAGMRNSSHHEYRETPPA
jgi:hypothetical protein